MGMVVRSNIMALNANRQLGMNNTQVGKSLEKLSSGFKINRAGDDASGLAISEKMKAQIKGLETASANSQDGISLVQTAEGALTEVHSMLNRMVELATKSANGTLQDNVDRDAIQSEVDALLKEVDRIGDSTNFNGINLLDGSLNETDAVTSTVKTGDAFEVEAGTEAVNREHKDAVNYRTEIAAYELKNTEDATSGADKTFVFSYKDTAGGDKTITMTLAKGKTASVDDIVSALNGSADGTNITTAVDNGTEVASGDGVFKELYTATKTEDNRIVIQAKSATDEAEIDGKEDKLGGFALNGALDASIEANQGTNVGEFAEVITKIDGELEGDTQATLGTTTVTMLAGKDIISGSTLKIGSETFEFVKDGNAAAAGNTAIAITDDNTAKEIAKMITDQSTDGATGFDLKNDDSAIITVSNTVTDGQNSDSTDANSLLTGDRDVRKAVTFTAATVSDVEVDASKLTNNTTVKVGETSYRLTYDENAVAENGETLVQYSKDDSSADIAAKLATAVGGKADDKTVTVNGEASAASDGLTLQIGDSSDTFNRMSVSVENMKSAGLGITGLDVSTANSAGNAIQTIKDAINTVSTNRANMGALQNRLEYTINNLDVSSENLTAANSRIRDTDMAKEMMAYTKMNVLTQSAQAMLAQANQQPQSILQLLQ